MNELTLSTALETALNRIEDMLSDDDGQAFKEARKFLPVGRAALAAQHGAAAWHPTPEEKADDDRGIRWVNQGKICGRPTAHDVREYLIRNARLGECTCPECKAFYAAAPTEATQPPSKPSAAAEPQGWKLAGWRHSHTHWFYDSERDVPLSDGDEWAEPVYVRDGEPQTEVVAWMHDEEGRVDVIHDAVKKLLLDQHAKGYSSPDYMHRPLGKVEHYTIPLYATPTSAPTEAKPAQADALNTLCKMLHSGEEVEGDDGLAMLVPMDLWNEAQEAIELLVVEDEAIEAKPAQDAVDAELLDWLEAQINEHGAIHLHDGNNPNGHGLGLRPGSLNRSLREAIRAAISAKKGQP